MIRDTSSQFLHDRWNYSYLPRRSELILISNSRVIPFFAPSHGTLFQRFARFNVVLMNFYASFSTFLSLTPSKWFRHIFILLVLRFILNEHGQWDRKIELSFKNLDFITLLFSIGRNRLVELKYKNKILKTANFIYKALEDQSYWKKKRTPLPVPFRLTGLSSHLLSSSE